MSSLEISSINNARNITRKSVERGSRDSHAKAIGTIFGTAGAISGLGIGMGLIAMKLQHIKWDYKLGTRADKFAKVITESTSLRRSTAILGGLGAAGLLGWGLYKITSNIISNQMD